MFAVLLRVTERLRDTTDKRKMHRQFPTLCSNRCTMS